MEGALEEGVWGECLRAVPPPPIAEAPVIEALDEEEVLAEVDEEAEEQPIKEDEEEVVDDEACAKAVWTEMPHACMAMSDVATWGTQESELMTETDMPSTSDEMPTLVDSSSDEEIDFDDDYVVHAGFLDDDGPQDEPRGDTHEDAICHDDQDD